VRRPSFYVSGGLLSRGPSTGKFIDLDKHPVFSNSSTGDIISADEVASSTPGIRGAELVAVSQEKNNNPLEHLTLILEYGIRFSVHIVLLSVFESLFFWKFVSVSEDDALNKLVNGYIEGTLDSCPRWNATERFIVSTFVDLLFNKTSIDKAGVSAANERNAFNAILFRNSWVYVACLAALLIVLCVWALIRKRHVPWTHIFLENLALIVILGLYEFLFFRTIVLVYRAVSGAELVRFSASDSHNNCSVCFFLNILINPPHPSPNMKDSQLLNKFVAQCQNGTWWAGRSA